MRWKGEKGKAWKVFSDYVRFRDFYTCITCGVVGEGSQIHAGHMIPVGMKGSNNELAWSEGNVFAQCHRCNVNLGGLGAVFATRVWNEYQIDVDDLLSPSRGWAVFKGKDWPCVREHYERKLREIGVAREVDPQYYPEFERIELWSVSLSSPPSSPSPDAKGVVVQLRPKHSPSKPQR